MSQLRFTTSYLEIFSSDSSIPIFASELFLKTQSNEFGWIYNESYAIPYYIRQKLIFRSLTFTSDAISLRANPDTEKLQEFMDSIVEETGKLHKVDFITCSPSYVLFQKVPAKSISCAFGSYRINLSQSEEDLFKNLHGKHRNVIRKAQNDGVQISWGFEFLDTAYKIIKETHDRQRLYFPSWDEFDRMMQTLKSNCICVIAQFDGKHQGAAIIPFDQQSGYYLYGGSSTAHHTGALNLMHWEIIRKLKDEKINYYDFVGARLRPEAGSKIEGIQRFKSRFGSELNTGYLWKYNYSGFKKKVYDLLIYLKTRQTPKDIIDNEN